MGPILGKVLTGIASEKVLTAVLIKLGDFLVKKSSNKLDDEIWAEGVKAHKKKEDS